MDEQEKLELEYLRYFYGEVGVYLGPADDDIYSSIKESYEGELPDSYRSNE